MALFNYRDTTGDEDHYREVIRAHAKRVSGGTTTAFMLKHKLRTLVQKHNVANEIEFSDAKHKGYVHVTVKPELHTKLWDEDKFKSFKQEVLDAIKDCGYAIRVSDDYTELSPA